MLNSDFWRDIAKDFCALDPTGTILKAHWIYDIDDSDQPCSKITWALTQSDGHRSVEASFMPLASRAAIRLYPNQPTTRLAVDIWLDVVKAYRKAEFSSDGHGMSMGKPTRWQRGAIDDVLASSTPRLPHHHSSSFYRSRGMMMITNPAPKSIPAARSLRISTPCRIATRGLLMLLMKGRNASAITNAPVRRLGPRFRAALSCPCVCSESFGTPPAYRAYCNITSVTRNGKTADLSHLQS